MSPAAQTLGHTARPPVTRSRIRKLYEAPESFTDLLPWAEYLPAHRVFALADGRSAGALFELQPVATDGQSAEYLAALAGQLQDLVTEAIPEEDPDAWVLQLFVQDEPSFRGFLRELRAEIDPRLAATPFSEHYLQTLEAHLTRVTAPEGLFEDRITGGGRWRGRRRRVWACLYRRARPGGSLALAELNDVSVRLTTALTSAGVGVRRGDGRMFYEWMLPWFNPKPALGEGDPARLLEYMPYPGDEDLPFGADLADALVLTPPRSEVKHGVWWFDGEPHTCVTVQGLRRAPEPGHYTAEKSFGQQAFALFDQLSEGTVLTLVITFKPQYQVLNHIAHVLRTAIGEGAESMITRETGEAAQRALAEGDKIYPLTQAFYLKAPDLTTLQRRLHRLHTLLVTHGIQPIADAHDLIALDSYIRHLPFNYEPPLERIRRRGRLTFSTHIASLLPLYGRSIGTGRPGCVFFNRAGDLVTFDPLNRQDRKKNAHMLIVGPTGSGKSATVNAMLLHALAVHRPRIFIIDAGRSFDLFGDHCRTLGLSVHQVVLEPKAQVSLPPFAGALRLLDQPLACDTGLALAEAEEMAEEDAFDEAPIDPLGQMELTARIMVTGGEDDPLHRLSRGGRLILRKAILQAAKEVKGAGRPQVLTEDVAQALRTLPDIEAHRKPEAEDMAEGLDLFCTGIQGQFFNREGWPWPQADITILELGLLAREGYEDSLACAYTSIMSHIQDFVERHQREGRATIVVNDEAHLITIHPLLAPYTAKAIRLWRKYGAWYWAITHSLEDFSDLARKMLNMMEWWLCLAMEVDEAEQVGRFRELTPAQRALLLAARKEPGKYTEGAILGAHFQALLRIIPPPLALALAMTEPEEKAERARIRREKGCTELEAAYEIAKRLGERSQ